MFNPKQQYEVIQDAISIRDFHDYWEEFVVRPPYQRKSVWSKKKKQALLDYLLHEADKIARSMSSGRCKTKNLALPFCSRFASFTASIRNGRRESVGLPTG
jgi:hypothetical protein